MGLKCIARGFRTIGSDIPRPVSGRGLAEPHGVADVLSQEAVGSIRDFRTAKIALAKRKPRPNRRRAGFSGAIGYGGLRKGSA